jgi:hypothetical protein
MDGHEKGILCLEGEPGKKGARSFMAIDGRARASASLISFFLLFCSVCLSFSHSSSPRRAVGGMRRLGDPGSCGGRGEVEGDVRGRGAEEEIMRGGAREGDGDEVREEERKN